MRIKQIVVAGMALAMLAGCGNDTTNESINDRGLDQVENVRYQPGAQDMNSFPDGDRGLDNGGEQNRQFNTTADDRSGGFFEDGRVDEYDRGTRRDQGTNRQSQQNNQSQGSQLARNESDNRQGNRQNRSPNHHQYEVSEDIADRVTSEVDEVENAYVLTMGDNAYVACHLNRGTDSTENELSDQLEREVTRAVKDSNNSIDNVYVSSNPDFIDLTSNYMRDIDRGEPIEGFVDQFTEMIERLFPTQSR